MKITQKQAEKAKALILKATGEQQTELIELYNGAEVVGEDGETVVKTLKFVAPTPQVRDDVVTLGAVVTKTEDNSDPTDAIVSKVVAKLEGVLKATRPNNSPTGTNPTTPTTKDEYQHVKVISRGRTTYFKGIREVEGADGTMQKQTAAERAYCFGMWALAAMGKSAIAEQFCQSRGIMLAKDMTDVMTTKLHQENINTAGGFFVPEQFGTDLIELKEQFGVARKLLRTEPMTSDTRTDPRRVGGLTPFFVGEGAAGTESTTQWDQVRLVAKDLMILTRMTNQLNADSVISWADRLAYEITYAYTLKEDQCLFLGDGTSTYGGISGLSTQLKAKWTPTAGTGQGLVQAAATGSWSSIVISDFNNVVGSLPVYATNSRTRWVCHKSFYGGVMQKLEIAGGGNTLSTIRDGDTSPVPLFLGYPVEFAQAMPGTSAATQISAYFGDLSLAGSFGDRQMDSISFSDQATVNGQSMWERNQMGVRGIERFDINVHDVGNGTAGTGMGPVIGLTT